MQEPFEQRGPKDTQPAYENNSPLDNSVGQRPDLSSLASNLRSRELCTKEREGPDSLRGELRQTLVTISTLGTAATPLAPRLMRLIHNRKRSIRLDAAKAISDIAIDARIQGDQEALSLLKPYLTQLIRHSLRNDFDLDSSFPMPQLLSRAALAIDPKLSVNKLHREATRKFFSKYRKSKARNATSNLCGALKLKEELSLDREPIYNALVSIARSKTDQPARQEALSALKKSRHKDTIECARQIIEEQDFDPPGRRAAANYFGSLLADLSPAECERYLEIASSWLRVGNYNSFLELGLIVFEHAGKYDPERMIREVFPLLSSKEEGGKAVEVIKKNAKEAALGANYLLVNLLFDSYDTIYNTISALGALGPHAQNTLAVEKLTDFILDRNTRVEAPSSQSNNLEPKESRRGKLIRHAIEALGKIGGREAYENLLRIKTLCTLPGKELTDHTIMTLDATIHKLDPSSHL